MKPACYAIARYKPHLCECGNTAVKKLSSHWICQRCSDISARNCGVQVTCGKRGARHGDVYSMPGGNRR